MLGLRLEVGVTGRDFLELQVCSVAPGALCLGIGSTPVNQH